MRLSALTTKFVFLGFVGGFASSQQHAFAESGPAIPLDPYRNVMSAAHRVAQECNFHVYPAATETDEISRIATAGGDGGFIDISGSKPKRRAVATFSDNRSNAKPFEACVVKRFNGWYFVGPFFDTDQPRVRFGAPFVQQQPLNPDGSLHHNLASNYVEWQVRQASAACRASGHGVRLSVEASGKVATLAIDQISWAPSGITVISSDLATPKATCMKRFLTRHLRFPASSTPASHFQFPR